MSDLEDALDRASVGLHENGFPIISGGTGKQLELLMDAARLVANPNYEAVAILICESVFGEDWDGEIPLVQLNQAKRYVVAALTPPEDTPT